MRVSYPSLNRGGGSYNLPTVWVNHFKNRTGEPGLDPGGPDPTTFTTSSFSFSQMGHHYQLVMSEVI